MRSKAFSENLTSPGSSLKIYKSAYKYILFLVFVSVMGCTQIARKLYKTKKMVREL